MNPQGSGLAIPFLVVLALGVIGFLLVNRRRR